MNFADFVKKCQDLLRDHPETGELTVFNTSCLDSPQRFETSDVFIGLVSCEDSGGEYERFLVTDNPDVAELLSNEKVAVVSITTQCVVIEAF
jgi:hypothetical protein